MDVEMLRGLCAIPAVSGSEGEIRNWIRGQVSAYAEEIREDALGNLIVRQKGKKAARTTLMVTAHMDESGLMVTHITEEGFLKVTAVGGIRPETLCGSPVRINGLSGIIGGKPVHLMDREERAKPVPLDQLSIDIGASSKEEAEKVVSVGDVATLDSLFEAEDEIVRARALDSRVGCALLMEPVSYTHLTGH